MRKTRWIEEDYGKYMFRMRCIEHDAKNEMLKFKYIKSERNAFDK